MTGFNLPPGVSYTDLEENAGVSVIRSRRRPEFAHLADEDVLNAYRKEDARQLGICKAMGDETVREPGDTFASLQEALTESEAHLFALDDELCARDLPLPK